MLTNIYSPIEKVREKTLITSNGPRDEKRSKTTVKIHFPNRKGKSKHLSER